VGCNRLTRSICGGHITTESSTFKLIVAKKLVAEIIIETLVAAGVKRIHGVVGDSLNGMLEEIRKRKDIEWVGTRHEEPAAFAAGAEAHVAVELTVCAGSCGPANMHLLNGLYDCHRSSVPVLAIAAQIPGNEIGSSRKFIHYLRNILRMRGLAPGRSDRKILKAFARIQGAFCGRGMVNLRKLIH
jgi:hypothetical protein